MVDGLIAMHLENYKASGAELIMGVRTRVPPALDLTSSPWRDEPSGAHDQLGTAGL